MPQPVPLAVPLGMAAELVAAFVSNNPLPRGKLPTLIQAIHDTLARLSAGVENSTPKEEPKEPAVSIRKSVTPEYLICLEDGKRMKPATNRLAAVPPASQSERRRTGSCSRPESLRARFPLPRRPRRKRGWKQETATERQFWR